MSERKVLNKYFPSDFDPKALKRQKAHKTDKLPPSRLNTPFPILCLLCGNRIPQFKKFNARKRTTRGETYLGVQIFHFYIRCSRCSGELEFFTDPKTNDYKCGINTKRRFGPKRNEEEDNETEEQTIDRLAAEEAAEAEAAEAEQLGKPAGWANGGTMGADAMEALEAKMQSGQREMAVADALDSIRANNARQEQTELAALNGEVIILAHRQQRKEASEEAEDAEAARAAFQKFAQSEDDNEGIIITQEEFVPPPVIFKKKVKVKKDMSALLGIKKKK